MYLQTSQIIAISAIVAVIFVCVANFETKAILRSKGSCPTKWAILLIWATAIGVVLFTIEVLSINPNASTPMKIAILACIRCLLVRFVAFSGNSAWTEHKTNLSVIGLGIGLVAAFTFGILVETEYPTGHGTKVLDTTQILSLETSRKIQEKGLTVFGAGTRNTSETVVYRYSYAVDGGLITYGELDSDEVRIDNTLAPGKSMYLEKVVEYDIQYTLRHHRYVDTGSRSNYDFYYILHVPGTYVL